MQCHAMQCNAIRFNTYIFFDVLLCSIAAYFDEPVGRVTIQTTSKNSQRYYITKRLIRDLLSNTPNGCVRAGEFCAFYFRGLRDRSMRSGTKLAPEILLTDWSTVGNLFNRFPGVQIPRDICTRCGRYFYSTKGSWIIKYSTVQCSAVQCSAGGRSSRSRLTVMRTHQHCASKLRFVRCQLVKLVY